MAKQKKPSSKSRKRRRRRGGTPALLVLLCVLIGTAAVITAMTIFFKIGQVRLTGDTRYSQQTVAEDSGLEPPPAGYGGGHRDGVCPGGGRAQRGELLAHGPGGKAAGKGFLR